MSPIPVHPNTYLAMAVFRPDTNPLSNSFVNTFFFGDTTPGADPDDVADSIKEVLDDFYGQANLPGTVTIASRMSSILDPAQTTYRVYDLGQTAPRDPHVRTAAVFTFGSDALPNEVAAVLSYRSGTGTTGGGSTDPTKRGRLYIGPLATIASTLVPTDQDVSISVLASNALAGGGDMLRDQTAEPLAWLQYSRKDDQFDFVTGGFVNNRFDTQRRRGADPTARTTW
jgi:hypothetical protein